LSTGQPHSSSLCSSFSHGPQSSTFRSQGFFWHSYCLQPQSSTSNHFAWRAYDVHHSWAHLPDASVLGAFTDVICIEHLFLLVFFADDICIWSCTKTLGSRRGRCRIHRKFSRYHSRSRSRNRGRGRLCCDSWCDLTDKLLFTSAGQIVPLFIFVLNGAILSSNVVRFTLSPGSVREIFSRWRLPLSLSPLIAGSDPSIAHESPHDISRLLVENDRQIATFSFANSLSFVPTFLLSVRLVVVAIASLFVSIWNGSLGPYRPNQRTDQEERSR